LSFSSFPTRRSSDLSSILGPSYCMSFRSSFFLCFLAFGRVIASAQTIAAYDKIGREELLKRSWDSSSINEKLAMRLYIADRYPRSEEHTSELQSLAY